MLNPFTSQKMDGFPLPPDPAHVERQERVDLMTARAERLEAEAASLRELAARLGGPAARRSEREE